MANAAQLPAGYTALLESVRTQYTAPWRSHEATALYQSATVPQHRARVLRTMATASPSGHLPNYARQSIIQVCQDLARNNSIARSIIARVQEHTVGNGPTVTSTSTDDEFNKKADAWFDDWFFQLGEEGTGKFDVRGQWNGVQALNATQKAWRTDGDTLWQLLRWGEVQIVESLLITSPGGAGIQRLANGYDLIDGIEVDRFGRHKAYHIGQWGSSQWTIDSPIRVPASDYTIFLPNPNCEWIGGVRGEPSLQAQWENITALDSFVRNTAVASELATFFGIIIKSDNPGAIQDAEEADSQEQGGAEGTIRLEAAMVKRLKLGESIEQIKPEFPQVGFAEFTRALAMLIGAEEGLPDVALLYNGAGLSWSNIKAILALAYRRRQIEQDVLGRLVRKLRTWKLEQWADDGLIELPPDYRKCNVKFPGIPVLSFLEEVKGCKMAVESNFMTGQQVCDQLETGNKADITRQRGIERKQEIEEGVVPLATPGSLPYVGVNRDGLRDADQVDHTGNNSTNVSIDNA